MKVSFEALPWERLATPGEIAEVFPDAEEILAPLARGSSPWAATISRTYDFQGLGSGMIVMFAESDDWDQD